jgi:hypothetical protein
MISMEVFVNAALVVSTGLVAFLSFRAAWADEYEFRKTIKAGIEMDHSPSHEVKFKDGEEVLVLRDLRPNTIGKFVKGKTSVAEDLYTDRLRVKPDSLKEWSRIYVDGNLESNHEVFIGGDLLKKKQTSAVGSLCNFPVIDQAPFKDQWGGFHFQLTHEFDRSKLGTKSCELQLNGKPLKIRLTTDFLGGIGDRAVYQGKTHIEYRDQWLDLINADPILWIGDLNDDGLVDVIYGQPGHISLTVQIPQGLSDANGDQDTRKHEVFLEQRFQEQPSLKRRFPRQKNLPYMIGNVSDSLTQSETDFAAGDMAVLVKSPTSMPTQPQKPKKLRIVPDKADKCGVLGAFEFAFEGGMGKVGTEGDGFFIGGSKLASAVITATGNICDPPRSYFDEIQNDARVEKSKNDKRVESSPQPVSCDLRLNAKVFKFEYRVREKRTTKPEFQEGFDVTISQGKFKHVLSLGRYDSIVWAGDANGDGRLDLIVQYYDPDFGASTSLMISKEPSESPEELDLKQVARDKEASRC